ncbi:armadillo-type protein [Talaromyces proteolyticus]|uniref:Nucleolar protein 9 n=1 Tax=Talaromyces proteolyticus TaxID=1131652 RepID=A0AAD4KHZ6_9EURO|nr:armadillo-type protein [Talaromyces proteolyticus]KAH8692678.1 armadillo-type protein [Talaromyces proteolyticus]
MPREKQKRGRRAQEREKKEGEEEYKRKREDDTEAPAVKRHRVSAEIGSEDFVPLNVDEDDVQRPDSNDTPFYGLLDPEEQDYFSKASEILELNQFQSPEERGLFVESVYEEAKGKELKIACSQSCSRLLEKVIALSDTNQIRRLFSKFLGNFLHLVQHRFASHCCETLFTMAAPALSDKATNRDKTKQRNNEEGDEEQTLPLADMFLQVITELEGNWGYLLTERFASHTIRVLLLVLAGEPVDISSNNSVVASKKKEKIGVLPVDTKDQAASITSRTVPGAFVPTLKKVMKDMTSGLDDTYLRALATHHIGNPVLQLLVSLELSHFGKSVSKDPKSIIHRLIPDDSMEEGAQSAIFLAGLLYDPVGSRLVETIVQHAPGKLFKNIHKNVIQDRISSLARNEIASYVLVRVLERIGRDDLQTDLDLIVPDIPSLIEKSRLNVPKVLIERCLVRNVDTTSLAKALVASLDRDPATRLHQLLKTEKDKKETEVEADTDKMNGNPEIQKSLSAVQLHASLLAQTMLQAPGPLSDLIYAGLLAISSDDLIAMALNSRTSHVVQKALVAPTSTVQFRRQFIPRFSGYIKNLALDNSGSHVVDVLWEASKDVFFVKERLAQELSDNEQALRDSFLGRAVWRNWSMDLYKRRRGEWKAKAKGIVDQTGATKMIEKKPVKSKLDLARERFDNAEKSAKLGGSMASIATKFQ